MVNRARPTINFEGEVRSVFNKYIQHHEGECKQFKKMHGLVQRLMLRLDEDEEEDGKLYLDLQEQGHQAKERVKNHEKHAAKARSLKKKFEQCTLAFGDSLRGPAKTRDRTTPRKRGKPG